MEKYLALENRLFKAKQRILRLETDAAEARIELEAYKAECAALRKAKGVVLTPMLQDALAKTAAEEAKRLRNDKRVS